MDNATDNQADQRPENVSPQESRSTALSPKQETLPDFVPSTKHDGFFGERDKRKEDEAHIASAERKKQLVTQYNELLGQKLTAVKTNHEIQKTYRDEEKAQREHELALLDLEQKIKEKKESKSPSAEAIATLEREKDLIKAQHAKAMAKEKAETKGYERAAREDELTIEEREAQLAQKSIKREPKHPMVQQVEELRNADNAAEVLLSQSQTDEERQMILQIREQTKARIRNKYI